MPFETSMARCYPADINSSSSTSSQKAGEAFDGVDNAGAVETTDCKDATVKSAGSGGQAFKGHWQRGNRLPGISVYGVELNRIRIAGDRVDPAIFPSNCC